MKYTSWIPREGFTQPACSEKVCSVPTAIFFFLLLCSHCGFASVGWPADVRHVGHLSHRRLGSTAHTILESLVSLSSLVGSVLLRVLLVLVLALGFLFTIEDHEFLTEMLVLHAQFLADLNKTAQAVNVVLVFFVNLFVDLEGLVE